MAPHTKAVQTAASASRPEPGVLGTFLLRLDHLRVRRGICDMQTRIAVKPQNERYQRPRPSLSVRNVTPTPCATRGTSFDFCPGARGRPRGGPEAPERVPGRLDLWQG